MTISVFIVNYNTCALLEQCLTCIFETKGDLDVEVFVADSNSTDGSAEMVSSKFPPVHLTSYSRNIGFTKAINRLLPMGRGDYYLLLHPDVRLLNDIIARFLEFFEWNPRAGILGGNLYYPDGTPNSCEILFPGFKNDLICFAVRLLRKLPGGRRLIGDYSPLEWSHESTSRVNWVWNACMIVRREVFQRIGYFDEDFYVWYADWDLCKRATDAGWSSYYIYSAKAIHYESQSFNEEGIPVEEVRYKIDGWQSAPAMIRDRHTFVRKHCSRGSLLGVKAVDIVQNVLRLWLILGRGLFHRASFEEVSFVSRACLQTIHAILRA